MKKKKTMWQHRKYLLYNDREAEFKFVSRVKF